MFLFYHSQEFSIFERMPTLYQGDGTCYAVYFDHGQNFDQIFCIDLMIADFSLKFCFDLDQKHQRDKVACLLTMKNISIDFQFNRGQRSEYITYMSATPLLYGASYTVNS